METPPSRPRPRIESLSDLVFGLALSIGAFAIIGNLPTTVSALYGDLLTFTFNFLILISVWMRYTRVMSALPLETRRTLTLNTVLLFNVSVEPFLFNVFQSIHSNTPDARALLEVSTSLYALDLGVMMLVLGIFTLTLGSEERKLVPAEMIKEFRYEALGLFVAAGFFLVSDLPIFDSIFIGGSFLRTDLWAGALIVPWVRRTAMRAIAKRPTQAKVSSG